MRGRAPGWADGHGPQGPLLRDRLDELLPAAASGRASSRSKLRWSRAMKAMRLLSGAEAGLV